MVSFSKGKLSRHWRAGFRSMERRVAKKGRDHNCIGRALQGGVWKGSCYSIQCGPDPVSPPGGRSCPHRDLPFLEISFSPLSSFQPCWPSLGLLSQKERRRRLEGALFCLYPRRRSDMHKCSHIASTSLQSVFPEGTCHHVNLLLTSSFLLLSRANWPFSSSWEHHRRCWQPPHSRQHLTHWVIYKTQTSQGCRLRPLCVVWTPSRTH